MLLNEVLKNQPNTNWVLWNVYQENWQENNLFAKIKTITETCRTSPMITQTNLMYHINTREDMWVFNRSIISSSSCTIRSFVSATLIVLICTSCLISLIKLCAHFRKKISLIQKKFSAIDGTEKTFHHPLAHIRLYLLIKKF